MRLATLLLPALVLVAACSATAPSPSGPVVPPTRSPSAGESPSPVPTALPSAPPASPAETPSPTPAGSPSPTPAGSPSPMTPGEAALVAELRLEAAVNCTPRRTDLPEGALYGVECRPDDALVTRVGIYRFSSPNEAAHAYMTRMAAYGVDVNAGGCGLDVPGDEPWTAGDHEGSPDDPGVFNWENSVLSPNRIGCFLDENGNANVRATCGLAYVGVLGAAPDLSALTDWTWRYPAGYEPGVPDAPGLCVHDANGARIVPATP